MPRHATSTHVAAPPQAVFDVFSDLENAPERVPSLRRVELLTEGPVRAGTRFRETRVMFGKEATEEMELTAFDPPRLYSVGCESHGARYDTDFRFTPDGDGTRVDVTLQVEPRSLAAKLLAPLMMSPLKKCVNDDVEALKKAVESGAGAARGTGAGPSGESPGGGDEPRASRAAEGAEGV